jgi:hypothetical protein
MAAALRIPALDRRQPALVDQPLKLCEAYPLQFDGRAALGHIAVIARSGSMKQSVSPAWIASLRSQ